MHNRLFQEALSLDVAGQYSQAAQTYERVIAAGNAPLEAFSNAAFLHWEVNFSSGFRPSPETQAYFDAEPSYKCYDLLVAGLRAYPDDLELYFLAWYFAFVAFGDELTEQQCLQLLRVCTDHNHSLMPHYFLYLCDEERYGQPAAAIAARCRAQPTAKHRWVLSVMQYD